MRVQLAASKDVEQLLPLFNAYRQFYNQPADSTAARDFLDENISGDRSLIYVAVNDDDEFMGFARVNVGNCSLDLNKYWILYDLYVDELFRKKGVASNLLTHVKQEALKRGASRIELQTAHSNLTAQKLYEQNGYKVDQDFRTYSLALVTKVEEDKAFSSASPTSPRRPGFSQ